MHVITHENSDEARQALRDILFLYVDLAESYNGFGHGMDRGTFDPFRFLDAEAEEPANPPVNLTLLRQGSAVALLCGLYDLWNEAEDVNIDHPWVERLRSALAQWRFAACPDIAQVMVETFERYSRFDDPWLGEQVQPLYEKYVAAYFIRLATGQAAG
ncbi:hypothetical protein [Deinococcus humi]|uniref:Uncharacterized protein n=1 Tax=Deinococcus humi TaxID=662880 RepID=A0A7W8JUT5_9DEIO|nr:hypothetical protein [Deinococcus humi]MBB5363667.1 hypothetical protein [Deinococcus humi]GGO29852.1 hypothetical protein GCM10008949_23910 [Deinococcus humi]